jgi:hypothetical protein
MIEKQFGTDYGPALQRGDKTACIVNLQAEIDRLGGVPYGWMKIYETLLFASIIRARVNASRRTRRLRLRPDVA